MVSTTTGSEEHLLVKLFDRIGPVIAIGNPADKTLLIGAARFYADALRKNWREVVETLLCKASLVILHAGHTEGFLWELEAVIREKSPERILLLISYKKSEYYTFRAATAMHFPSPLPDYNGAGRTVPSSIKGFIQFDADWTPHFIRMPWRLGDVLIDADGEAYLNETLPEILEPFLSRVEALNRAQLLQPLESLYGEPEGSSARSYVKAGCTRIGK
jgi:hypothetical protein